MYSLFPVYKMDFHHRKPIFGQIVVTKWVSTTGNPLCGHIKKKVRLNSNSNIFLVSCLQNGFPPPETHFWSNRGEKMGFRHRKRIQWSYEQKTSYSVFENKDSFLLYLLGVFKMSFRHRKQRFVFSLQPPKIGFFVRVSITGIDLFVWVLTTKNTTSCGYN